MIILGIDPGYAILGYGAVEAERGKIRVIDYGVVETTPKMTFPERLERLYAGTKLLLERYRPDHVAFEELFFYRNTTTANLTTLRSTIRLARGAIMQRLRGGCHTNYNYICNKTIGAVRPREKAMCKYHLTGVSMSLHAFRVHFAELP